MKNGRTGTSQKKHFHVLTFIGIVVLAGAALTIPVHSVLSSSASLRHSGTRGAIDSAPEKRTPITKRFGTRSLLSATSYPMLVSPALVSQTIATYDGTDCSTPKTDFNLGDTVCVKAAGVPSSLFPWQVNWVGPYGLINESDAASTDDTTEYRYTLPATATSVLNGETVDNRGRWRVNLAKANGALRETAWFTVHEPANPQADVQVQKFQRDSSDAIHSGDNAAFVLVVENDGPDPALNVHLVDSVPAGGTLVSFNQDSGSTCTAAGPNDCTIASLANGARAEFTVIYSVSGGAGSYETSASVSSDTPDQNNDDNSSTANYVIVAGTSAGTCDLTCPSDITTNANTTVSGQRGAYVNYDAAVSSGTCGSISSSPASGSFFPVGTTVVTVTSETGNGACQFSITVEESTGNVSITCPASLTGTANNNCEASFNLGSPTTTGDNVTVTVSRSDGKPMYDCDQNGENCVRKSTDLPFSTGVTSVTWTAYSHNTAGPWATAAAEEADRTGSASCVQTVTVNDTTPPVIAATDQTVSADANCQAVIPDYSSTVSDNCACSASDQSQDCAGHPNVTVTQTPAPGTVVGPGAHTVHITANDNSSNNDGAGNTSEKDITFTVNDTTAPQISCPDSITTNTVAGTCAATVVTGTATATDNCDSTPTITATRSDNQSLAAAYPKGTTTITWRATDDAGNYSECTQTVTVVDNEPPTINFNGLTPSMWPPNHTYHTFTAGDFIASVSDNCDPLTINDVEIISATSDEAENGGGDGNTSNDIVIASDCKSIQLRAERQNNGNGRVYTITFRLRDTSGNTTVGTARVYSPKNQGETPVDDGPHYSVAGSCP